MENKGVPGVAGFATSSVFLGSVVSLGLCSASCLSWAGLGANKLLVPNGVDAGVG